MRNGLATVFILGFLATQLAAPASYYFVQRDQDPFDERFAWRMFSDIRMVRCDLQVTEGPYRTRVSMGKEVHMLWINLMKRARKPVIDRFAEVRCAELVEADPDTPPELYIDVTCRMPDGATSSPVSPEINQCEAR